MWAVNGGGVYGWQEVAVIVSRRSAVWLLSEGLMDLRGGLGSEGKEEDGGLGSEGKEVAVVKYGGRVGGQGAGGFRG